MNPSRSRDVPHHPHPVQVGIGIAFAAFATVVLVRTVGLPHEAVPQTPMASAQGEAPTLDEPRLVPRDSGQIAPLQRR